METIDIAQYKTDDKFYGKLELVLTVKSFELQKIRERYLASRNRKDGKVGSVERREVAMGGIVKVVLEDGVLVEFEVLAEMKEPRGIAWQDGCLGIAAENTVYLLDGRTPRTLNNKWFSYIHTLDFAPTGSARLLVVSSGFDCIFEYDLDKLSLEREWFAWEHGFATSTDPTTEGDIWLTRDARQAKIWEGQGKTVRLFDDPESQVLPTAQRSAFINSVVYDGADSNHFLATFFHAGKVYRAPWDGEVKPVIENLKNPHGGNNVGSNYMATSTASGEVVTTAKDHERRYSFCNLPGKPEVLGEHEWLQNSIRIEDYVVTIDSNRNSFVIFHPEKGLRSMIPYDHNWAVQDLIRTPQNKVHSSWFEGVGEP